MTVVGSGIRFLSRSVSSDLNGRALERLTAVFILQPVLYEKK